MAKYFSEEELVKDLDWLESSGNKSLTLREMKERLECGAVKPAAEVAPVAHGRWELYGNDDDIGCSYFCSGCGWNFDEDAIFDCSGIVNREFPNYCPNCGARMDKEAP